MSCSTNPDQFAYVGVWSAGLFGGSADEWEKRNEAFLSSGRQGQPTRSSCSRSASATRTSLLAGSKSLAEVLEKRGIKHEVHISGGGHTWINWRHYLSEFAPRLFR